MKQITQWWKFFSLSPKWQTIFFEKVSSISAFREINENLEYSTATTRTSNFALPDICLLVFFHKQFGFLNYKESNKCLHNIFNAKSSLMLKLSQFLFFLNLPSLIWKVKFEVAKDKHRPPHLCLSLGFHRDWGKSCGYSN